MQSKATLSKQSRAEQNKAKQSKAKQSKAKQRKEQHTCTNNNEIFALLVFGDSLAIKLRKIVRYEIRKYWIYEKTKVLKNEDDKPIEGQREVP